MKIGITSQNFRTITGHAGKTRRFLVYALSPSGEVQGQTQLDLPKELSIHEFRGKEHPVYDLDVLITASCGQGFRTRLGAHGVEVVTTSESDPQIAVKRYAQGEPLPPAEPHDHEKGHSVNHAVRSSGITISTV